MSLRPVDCMSRIRLGGSELAWLEELHHGVHEVEPHPWCELEAGHTGPHAALAQTADRVDWWVRWTPDVFEVVSRENCPAVGVPKGAVEDEPCTLYDGHPGRHSYDLP